MAAEEGQKKGFWGWIWTLDKYSPPGLIIKGIGKTLNHFGLLPEWMSDAGEILDNAPLMGRILTYTAVGVGCAAVAAGSYYVMRSLIEIPAFVEVLLDIVVWPVVSAWKIFRFFTGSFAEWVDWLAQKTSTYKEMWWLAIASGIVLLLTDIAYTITDHLWQAELEPNSLWWKTFEFMQEPINWLWREWTTLFSQKWNPLHWLIMLPISFFEILIILVLPLAVVVNPYFWIEKLKTLVPQKNK